MLNKTVELGTLSSHCFCNYNSHAATLPFEPNHIPLGKTFLFFAHNKTTFHIICSCVTDSEMQQFLTTRGRVTFRTHIPKFAYYFNVKRFFSNPLGFVTQETWTLISQSSVDWPIEIYLAGTVYSRNNVESWQ